MTQGDGDYDLKPPEPPPPAADPPPEPPTPASAAPKPGEPGWVPPVPIIETADAEGQSDVDPDIEKHKGMAVLGYICFLIPLMTAPNSKFARFHANQGLLLFILLIITVVVVIALYLGVALVGIVFKNITILDYFFSGAFHLLQFTLLVAWAALVIYGIIQAANGLTKPLPGIGHWTLIK